MNWRSTDQVLPGLASFSGAATISKPFSTNDPRFVVITVRSTGTGTLELWDYNDNDQTDASGALKQSVSLAATETVLRYDVGTNGLLRNILKARVSGGSSVVVTQVSVCAVD